MLQNYDKDSYCILYKWIKIFIKNLKVCKTFYIISELVLNKKINNKNTGMCCCF